jgi:hypothetical protein
MGREQVDHRLLELGDEPLDRQAAAAQVEQNVGDDLPRPVICDLAAAIDARDGNPIPAQQMLWLPGLPEGVNRRVLEEPQLVGRRRRPRRAELPSGRTRAGTRAADVARQVGAGRGAGRTLRTSPASRIDPCPFTAP